MKTIIVDINYIFDFYINKSKIRHFIVNNEINKMGQVCPLRIVK